MPDYYAHSLDGKPPSDWQPLEEHSYDLKQRYVTFRFPSDFMFQLTREEFSNLKSHFGTSSWGGTRKLPRAFTEQGVAMLSSVLKSKRAVMVNIEIMRAFVKLRRILTSNTELARKLDELEKKYDKQFKIVFEAIRALMVEDEKPKRKIYPVQSVSPPTAMMIHY